MENHVRNQQPSSLNRFVASSGVVSGLATMLLAGCGSSHAAAGQGGFPPTAVTVTQVARQTLEASETLDGQVLPFLQANIATQTSGTILKVYYNQGEHVQAGAILAKIDDSPLQAQLSQQQGAQVQAVAKLQQAQIQEPITSQTATSALNEAQLSLTQAQQQLIADQASVHQNEVTYTADKKLLAEGYVAQTTFAQARASYIASQQVLTIDQSRVNQAQAALDAARRNMLTVNLQHQVVAENRGAVQQAIGNVQLLRTQVGQTILTAPFDGVITQRMLDPGAYAAPNQPVYSLAKMDKVYVTFNLQDADFAYVHAGTPVTFTSSALPKRVFSARVDVVNIVPANGTLLYPARMTVDNPDESLRSGMLVNVRVVKSRAIGALVLPRSAVVAAGPENIVYMVSNDAQPTAKRIVVKTGIETGDLIEVMSPELRPGTTVVRIPPDSLHDGAPVKIVQQQAD